MRRGRPPYPDFLTPREQEVLGLLRDGLTNEQIARRLDISESGARYHVSEILSKLGVSSRQEAARWPADRRAFGLGGLLARRLPGKAPAAVVAVALAGLLALALGVVLMSSRRDGGGDEATVDTPVSEEAAIQRLRDLADEAKREALVVLPDAELVFVAYATPSGLYTFRFGHPGTEAEVSVLGPHLNDPATPRWERIEDELPFAPPPRSLLDLEGVRNSFEAVAEAAVGSSPSFADTADNMGLILFNEDGELTWGTMAVVGSGSLIRCRTPDADLALMTCESPSAPRGGPSP